MRKKWIFENDKPIYSQIIKEIKLMIISGELELGESLASVRDLASEAEVNPNTMQRALAELEREGFLVSQRTNGRFVTENEGLIKSVKSEIADNNVEDFLEKMKQLGYTKQEIIDLIIDYKEVE